MLKIKVKRISLQFVPNFSGIIKTDKTILTCFNEQQELQMDGYTDRPTLIIEIWTFNNDNSKGNFIDGRIKG